MKNLLIFTSFSLVIVISITSTALAQEKIHNPYFEKYLKGFVVNI